MSKTTAIGLVETLLAMAVAAQALPDEAWKNTRFVITMLGLAALKTLRDILTQDKLIPPSK